MVWPLVGRDDEVGRLEALLADESAGGIVLAGPAGVGKTRLATEAARLAAARGGVVEWVRATRSAAAIPLGAFSALLPAVGGSEDAELLVRARHALTGRADGRRLVLCVDDGQLLDATSAALVHQLVVAGDAFAVVTLRSDERVPDALRALWKDELCAHLELGELARAEVEALLGRVLGGPVEGTTLGALWRLTRGNVLFLRELVLLGVEHGRLAETGGIWVWRGEPTAGVRLAELVEARLEGLDPAARAVLEVVAVGAPLEADLVLASEAAALEVLELHEVVVRRIDGRRRLVDVAHPLHGEVVRARLAGTRLEAVQRRLADSVAGRGARRSADALRVASWRLASGGAGDPALFERAAWQALDALDVVLAERCARAALDAGGGFSARLALGRALAGADRAQEADAVLAGLDVEARTDAERMAVATASARNLAWGLDRGADADATLVAAEHAIADPALRSEVVGLRAWLMAARGRPLDALAVAAPVSGLRAAVATAWAHALRGRTADAVAVTEAWEAQAGDVARDQHFLLAQLLDARGTAFRLSGRLAEATEVARRSYDLEVGHGATMASAIEAFMLSVAWLARGQVRTALRWARESAALLRGRDGPSFLRWALAAIAQAAAQAGDAGAARAAAAEIDLARVRGAWIFAVEGELGRAWAAAAAGELSRARAYAAGAADLALAQGQDGLAARAFHELARLGDPAAAAPALAALVAPPPGEGAVPSRGGAAAGGVPSGPGDVPSGGGVEGAFPRTAAAHAAALVAGDGPALLAAAEAFAAQGALLVAAEAADAAANAFQEAGRQSSARAAALRASGWLAACEGAQPPTLRGRAGPAGELTQREREIALLAASGMSSREIADRLVVSVRTVDNHLQRTYRKLGISRREDLADVLAAAR